MTQLQSPTPSLAGDVKFSSAGTPFSAHLSSCTSERQHVCYMWGLSFLGITTQNMSLHCLNANAAYVGFVNYFFFSPLAVHLMEEKVYFWGDYAGTICILWCVAEDRTSVLLVLFLLASLLPQQADSPLLQYYSVWTSWFTVLSLTQGNYSHWKQKIKKWK